MPNPSRRAVLISAGGAALTAFGPKASGKIGGVELGVCGNADVFSKAEQWGFDYFEPSAAATAAMTPAAYASFRDKVLASKIRCRSFNSLIRSLKVAGPDRNLDAVSSYLDSALDRCHELGARVAVWGSASSREVPSGYSRETAWGEIKTFLARAGEIAKAKQIMIGIEPLRKQESNIINTGAEALRLVREVNHPQVKMIIDYYHLRVEKEDPEILRTAKEHIVHLHFANPEGRRWPKLPEEDAEYRRFFTILKQINYVGGLSIEGTGTFEDDAEASLKFFRGELS
jgi:D-psicose/D-tagatose/L-ribulose 3-epimerase